MKQTLFHGLRTHTAAFMMGIYAFFALTFICVSTPVAQAAELFMELDTGTPNFVGLGVGGYPDYLGSDDYAVGAAPFAKISLGGERYVQVLATDVKVNVLNHRNWRLGPELLYRFSREDVDDSVVDKMEEIDGSFDLGLFGGYTWIDSQNSLKRAGFSVAGLWDVSGVHDGYTFGATVFGMYPVARPVTVAAGASFTWGSEDYMDTYFGVSSEDSRRSGLPIFTADSGVRDLRGWVTGMFHFNVNWHLAGGVMYSRLVEDASDSPIVSERGSEDQWIYGVGVIYGW